MSDGWFLFLSQTNEYIFSLLEPQNTEKTTAKEKSFAGKEQQMEEKQVKSNGEAERIILGLKLSRKRLHFLFKGHGESVEHWVFRGIRLADNQWHTLVLAVAHNYMRLTVDCSSPLEM